MLGEATVLIAARHRLHYGTASERQRKCIRRICMNIVEAMERRHAVRDFSDRPIDDDTLRALNEP